jgi:hypothetical protein
VRAQLTRPTDPTETTTLRVPLRGRVIIEDRLPTDDDSAPYPAAGGFYWDQVLRQKRGLSAPD